MINCIDFHFFLLFVLKIGIWILYRLFIKIEEKEKKKNSGSEIGSIFGIPDWNTVFKRNKYLRIDSKNIIFTLVEWMWIHY